MHGIVNVRKLRNGDLKRKQTMIKILIIEDEIRLADVLYDWFYNKNFQVTVCHDGISGYETALKNSYDAIISDVMLPGMDGFSIVKKLRGMKVWTPIIMLTARVELQDKLQGFDAGVSEEEIVETAEKLLETKKTSGSYENYQFEITVHEGELLIAFADITSLIMDN